MFGKIIYYDKNTISEYKSIITGQKQLVVAEYEVTNGKGLGVDFKAVKADISADKKYIAKVTESVLFDCNEFEKLLAEREGDDYFDFTDSDDYDINSVPKGSIIKIEANISIPEDFDLMQLVERFKPFLMSYVQSDIADLNERAALEPFFSEAKATKIPVEVDSDDDILLCTKILKDNLLIDIQEFTDTDEEVTILARVSSNKKRADKPFYDPLKDFLSLNRTTRKSMESRDKSMEPITVDEDYRMIDVLAIYR